MTKAEFKPIAKGLRIAYEREGFLTTPDKMSFWYEHLKGFKAFTVRMAADDYIDHNKYQPSISDLYEICEKYESKYRSEMREIFEDAKGTYPCPNVTQEAVDAWNEITASEDWSERAEKARALQKRIIRFVREHELDGTIDDIPTLTECLRGMADELRS